MLTLSKRNQLLIGLALALLMVATRGHHFASLNNLPGASWAIFFLAGVYLRPSWVLPGLLAMTWLLDFAGHAWGDSSGFCLTRAYVFLLPAYAALWLAGHWYARRYRFRWRTVIPLSVSVLAGASVCELFSSGGFYFFSGRFVETTFTEFGTRLITYFPSYLQSLLFYVAIAAIAHVAFALANNTSSQHDASVS